MRNSLPVLFALAMASAAPAEAQTSGEGTAAYQRGDYAAAKAIYRRVCDGGDMLGCRGLGILYAVGQGVQQDFAQAEALFRQGCKGGDAESCRLAELAKSDKELAASQQSSKSQSTLPPGHPVTPGGAACETVELLDKQSGLGSTGHTRYTYKLSNDSRCGVIWIELVAGDVEYNERRLAPGETREFLCFTGLSHEPNCGRGITGWSVRLGK